MTVPSLTLPATDRDTRDEHTPPPTDEAHDHDFLAWAERRDARLRAAHRAWRRAGRPHAGLVDLIESALAESPWTRADVLDWLAHAHAVTGRVPTVGATTLVQLARVAIVPNASLRAAYLDAVENGRTTPSRIARRAGFVADGRADVTGIERALGVQATGDHVRLWIGYVDAVTISTALGVDPAAAGV